MDSVVCQGTIVSGGLVERCIGVDVPTQDEMSEIEPSSRLYEQNDALYMTLSALRGVEEGQPATTESAT